MRKTELNIDEKLLSLLISSVTDYAIFMIDPKGNIVSWNKGAENIKGYSEKEIIGKNISVFYTPADNLKQEPQHNLSEALKNGSYESEGLRVKKDGSAFWANVVFTPLYDDNKKLLGFAKVTRDITERKREEDKKAETAAQLTQKVKDSTAELRAYQLALDDSAIVAITDQKGIITHVNDNFCKISKYSRKELLGQDHRIINSAFHDKAFIADLWKTIAKGNTWKGELKNKAKDGAFYWVDTTIVPFLNEAGKPYQYVAIRSDITEKKESDFKLKKMLGDLIEREAMLNKAEAIGKIGSLDIDLVTQKRKWSIGMEAILGYKHGDAEHTFETFNTRVHPDDKEALLQKIGDAFEKLDMVDLEFRIITPDNVVKHALSRLMISRDEHGKAYRANGFMQDITEKKITEQSLEKSRTELQDALDMQTTILDALPPSIALLNSDGEIRSVNEAWKKFAVSNTLKTPDYGIGYNYITIAEQATGVDKETGNQIACGIKAVIDGEVKDFTIEYPCDSPDESRWFQAVVAPLNDKIHAGVVILHINITDRKLAELKLSDREMHYRQIVETAQEGIWIMDAELKIIFVNKKMAEMLEYEPSEMIGKYSYDFKEDPKKQEPGDQREKRKSGIKESHETIFISKTGSRVIFNVSTNGLFDIYGAFTGTLAMLTDITERKNEEWKLLDLNESLKKHTEELAISNAELEQFAFVASHDLQEPLRMVTSFMTQLEKKYGDIIDERGKQYIHFAVDGAKRMRLIILDLLDFSRVGKTEDDLEEVDLNDLVNEILVLYRRPIDEQQVIIRIENLPTLHIFKTPIRQVFQNLIGNSLKYRSTNKLPVIEIACKETNTQIQFSVKDNGIGISKEYFDKIFIIFQRLHNKDEYSGTGMGLAIAKKIVENFGGKIWVESEEGKGSTFYFTLIKK